MCGAFNFVTTLSGGVPLRVPSSVSTVMPMFRLSHPVAGFSHLVVQAAFWACPLLSASGVPSQSERILLGQCYAALPKERNFQTSNWSKKAVAEGQFLSGITVIGPSNLLLPFRAGEPLRIPLTGFIYCQCSDYRILFRGSLT